MSASKRINISRIFSPGQMIDLVFMSVLLITAICIFVPFAPNMPSNSLDESFSFSLEQGVAQDLSFGKELISTFGPYSSIYYQIFHPSTGSLMMIGSFYLAVSYWLCIAFLLKNSPRRWAWAFLAVLAGIPLSRDVLLFSYPLLAALTTFKSLHTAENGYDEAKYPYFLVVILLFPFGLLPLIKGSILIICSAITALCTSFFIAHKKYLLALTSAAVPVISMPIFWLASGQTPFSLPDYFVSMLPITSGYTEAMSLQGPISEVVLYLVASTVLFIAIFVSNNLSKISKTFLFCVFFIFLFIAFKSGFVRHDAHAMIAAGALLLIALLFPLVAESKLAPALFFIALLAWLSIDNHYVRTSLFSIWHNTLATYTVAWRGLELRLNNKSWPKSDFDTAVLSLKEQARLPDLHGTTDIYSNDQSFLIASGNSWNPRPAFQSFFAYTPTLVELNRKHLLSDRAPDNIIFRLETIDGRIPSAEDGASWPVILENYQPTLMDNKFLFFKKIYGAKNTEPTISGNGSHHFGDRVEVPNTDKLVFAEISIRPSVLGKLAKTLFKSAPLQINIQLENGAQRQYRIIAGMVQAGLVISPLIENTLELALLYGGSGDLDDKVVDSFSIGPVGGDSRLWHNEYTVTFKQFGFPQPVDLSKAIKFDSRVNDSLGRQVSIAAECAGNIDSVNGVNLGSASTKILPSGILRVSGWLTTSVEKPTKTDAVFLVLRNERGETTFFQTQLNLRPDVGAHFMKPELNESGYESTVDVSEFNGKYTLGIAFRLADKVKICPQNQIPIHF